MKAGDSAVLDTRYQSIAFMTAAKNLGHKTTSRTMPDGKIMVWIGK